MSWYASWISTCCTICAGNQLVFSLAPPPPPLPYLIPPSPDQKLLDFSLIIIIFSTVLSHHKIYLYLKACISVPFKPVDFHAKKSILFTISMKSGQWQRRTLSFYKAYPGLIQVFLCCITVHVFMDNFFFLSNQIKEVSSVLLVPPRCVVPAWEVSTCIKAVAIRILYPIHVLNF